MRTTMQRHARTVNRFGRSVLRGLFPHLIPLLALLAMTTYGWAALPAPISPDSGTAAAGDFIDYMKFTIKDILLIIALVVSTAGFIIVAFSAFAKFNEARRDRAEWGEVFTLVLVGGFILVAAGFLLNQTLEIIA